MGRHVHPREPLNIIGDVHDRLFQHPTGSDVRPPVVCFQLAESGVLKCKPDDSCQRLGGISPAPELPAQTVFDLCSRDIIIHPAERYLSDAFAAFFLYDRPSVIAIFPVFVNISAEQRLYFFRIFVHRLSVFMLYRRIGSPVPQRRSNIIRHKSAAYQPPGLKSDSTRMSQAEHPEIIIYIPVRRFNTGNSS